MVASSEQQFTEFKDIVDSHEKIINWLDSRLGSFNLPGFYNVEFVEIIKATDQVEVYYNSFNSTESHTFGWEELFDETNATYERVKAERRAEQVQRDKALALASAQADVERHTRELQRAHERVARAQEAVK